MSYFWTDVAGLSRGALSAIKRRDFSDWSLRFCIWILIATLPILVAGVALSKTLNTCNSPLRALSAIGIAYIVMGVLLALAEIYSRHKRTFDDINLTDALIVGFAQCGALIPGVSRSGSTFTAALFRDLERARGGALFLSARHPGDRRRGIERNLGIA